MKTKVVKHVPRITHVTQVTYMTPVNIETLRNLNARFPAPDFQSFLFIVHERLDIPKYRDMLH